VTIAERWVKDLVGFAGLIWQAQQKVSHRVEVGGSGAWQRCDVAVEKEASTSSLERAALGLEMVKLGVVPLDSAAETMLSSIPAQVCSRHILVIAELEWVSGVRVPEINAG